MKHIHTSYYQYYIKKTISHVNNKYMPHIYRIHHNVYIPSVNANSPKIITIGEVYNYFDNIDIGRPTPARAVIIQLPLESVS